MVLGFGFGELLSETLILPLENAGFPKAGAQASLGPPRLKKRDAATAEETEGLGRVDGGPSEPSGEEGLEEGAKSF